MRAMHCTLALLLLFALCICPQALAASSPSTTSQPFPVHSPFRLAYIEAGPSTAFNNTLVALTKGLEKKGLIPKIHIPLNLQFKGHILWQWLSQHAKGGKVEFLPDGYYSANGDAAQRAAVKNDLLRRLTEKGDVDLILAMGTAAGLDMVTGEHTVPTFVLDVTDPVQAGISRTATDSGRDHVYVQVLPLREKRQLTLFHKMFHFKRLGIIYEDSPEGRAVVGLHKIEEAAQQNGFSLVRCTFVPTDTVEERNVHLRQSLKEVAEATDAVYLTFTVTAQTLPMNEILQPFIKAGIPTFSQRGVEDTRQGVLMSLSSWKYDEMGEAQAQAVLQVMQGAKPRSLKQIFSPRLGLAINLRMAALIDWDIPPEALVAVDELCDQVEGPTRIPLPQYSTSAPQSSFLPAHRAP